MKDSPLLFTVNVNKRQKKKKKADAKLYYGQKSGENIHSGLHPSICQSLCHKSFSLKKKCRIRILKKATKPAQ